MFLPGFASKQLPGFSISSLASVDEIFNVYVFFKFKYICEYKRLFI